MLAAFLWLHILTPACADLEPLQPDPYDAARIEGGVWHTQPPASPLWVYEFNYPYLRQYIIDFGIVVTEQEYIYAPKHDTLFISGTGGQRTLLLYFENDSTCFFRQITGVLQTPAIEINRHF